MIHAIKPVFCWVILTVYPGIDFTHLTRQVLLQRETVIQYQVIKKHHLRMYI